MDLSWCIICDCHSAEDNLYCSETCRIKDIELNKNKLVSLQTPPASPLLNPYLTTLSYDRKRRTSVTLSRSSHNHHPHHNTQPHCKSL